MIPENTVTEWVENYKRNNKKWKIDPSFFELTVAMTFDYFAQQKVDVAVIEVGLGGRLDSTNIITPEVSVITNISLDHTDLLGETLEKIAFEKAGIIKKGVPVLIGETQSETKPVFEKKAESLMAPIFFADKEYRAVYSTLTLDGKQMVRVEKKGENVLKELQLDLLGNYQLKNLPTVLKALDILIKNGWKITEQDIFDGLKSILPLTGLRGRWQILGNNPRIVCDTGHNEDGIKMVLKQIENTGFKTLHFVFGTVGDKNPDNILRILPKNAVYYFTRANIPRAMNEKELAQKAATFGLNGKAYSSAIEAFEAARHNADKSDLIFVGGSTFVVGEIL